MAHPVETISQGPLTIAIGGGKGGVGKTMVAANLSAAIARLGFRVIAVDADFGSANLHTLLGVERMTVTLHGLFDGTIQNLEEAVVATAIPRLFLVAGSDAIPGAANLPHAQKLKLVRHIRKLDTEAVVIDCGAGVSFNVVDLFNLADRRILVASPQLISLQNCYGFLKASFYRAIRDWAVNESEIDLFKQACNLHDTDRIRDLISRINDKDPDFALEIARLAETFDASILGNQLDKLTELNAVHALTRMIGDFLSIKVPVVGGIRREECIHRSVTLRRPFILDSMFDPASKTLLNLAESLLSTDLKELRQKAARVQRQSPEPSNGSAPPSAVAEQRLPQSLSPYKRAHERVVVDWPVEIEGTDGREAGRIQDASIKGAKIIWHGTTKPGDTLQIIFVDHPTKLALSARVVWVTGDLFGVEFLGDQASAQIGEMLKRQEPVNPA